jgi:hypothetical protein
VTSRTLQVIHTPQGVQRIDALAAGAGGSGAAGPVLYDWANFDTTTLDLQAYTATGGTPTVSVNSDDRLVITGVLPNADNERWSVTDPATAGWTDGEIETVCWGDEWRASAAYRTLAGLVMREQVMPNGDVQAIVLHTDIIFSPTMFYLGIWKATPSGGSFLSDATAFSANINSVVSETATDGSRTSNVVTLTGLTPRHKIPQGGRVNVDAADNSYDGNAFVVTERSATTIKYAQTAANDASAGASTMTLVWPYRMKARLEGDILMGKVWRYLDPEPDWSDPMMAGRVDLSTLPTLDVMDGPGKWGVIGGTLRTDCATQYGPVTMTRFR